MDESTPSGKKGSASVEDAGGVEQIREIIVGDDLRSIQAALKDLKKQINDLKKTLGSFKDDADEFNENFQASTSEEIKKAKESAAKQKKDIEDSMGNMMKNIRAQLKKLDENKVDKSKIGQVFMEWGQKMNELQG